MKTEILMAKNLITADRRHVDRLNTVHNSQELHPPRLSADVHSVGGIPCCEPEPVSSAVQCDPQSLREDSQGTARSIPSPPDRADDRQAAR
jgi:hypothetical protein